MDKPIVRETHARTVLVKSRLPGARYVINPYGGCSHGCVYCYAVFMEKYHGMGEPWGSYVNVKVNAPEVLERDLSTLKSEDMGTVLISSVCDPYLPEEGEFKLTRRLLAMLLAKNLPVSILTKGRIGLVTRDRDLFAKFGKIEVGLTITGLSEAHRKLWEPRASPHKERIRTLEKLKREGISTWAFVGPVLPGITDIDLVFRDLEGLADHILIDKINIKKGVWNRLQPFLAKYYPKLEPLYEEIMKGNSYLENDMLMKVKEFSGKYNIKIV